MPTEFPATEPAWALRAYLVLIGYAYRAETITYGELAGAVNRGGPHLMEEPLNCLDRWCIRTGLPKIASLVVERTTGTPEPSSKLVDLEAVQSEQDKVLTHDWFSCFPPTIDELGSESA
jgi:hypothetical protein